MSSDVERNHEGYKRRNNSFCPECDTKQYDNLEGKVKCHECESLLMLTITPKREAKLYSLVTRNEFHHHSRAITNPNGDVVIYEGPKEPSYAPHYGEFCINCNGEAQATTSTKGRMLDRYLEKWMDHPTLKEDDGSPVQVLKAYPTYKAGRVCKKCVAFLEPVGLSTRGANEGRQMKPSKPNHIEFLYELEKFDRTPLPNKSKAEPNAEVEAPLSEVPIIDSKTRDVLIYDEVASVVNEEKVDVAAYRAFYKLGK